VTVGAPGSMGVHPQNGVWTQQGSKLVGSGAVGNAYQGISVALSGVKAAGIKAE
jgi:hypothetical protein